MKTDIKNPKELFYLFTQNREELKIESIEFKLKVKNQNVSSVRWSDRYIITLQDKNLTEITIEESGDLSIDDYENIAKRNVWIKKLYKFLKRNQARATPIRNSAYMILSEAIADASSKENV